jgi:mono/diheme cytochrome c family protein
LTEIPEHLLKRAAARKAALGQGGDAPADAPATDSATAPAAAAPAAAVPAKAAAPAPLPTLDEATAAPEPELAVVAAAKRRKRVPYWAATVLAFLPLWGIMYVSAVKPPPAGEGDPLVIGAEAYVTAGCNGCHGGGGEGGTGPALSNGSVIDTFSDPLSQIYWIQRGSQGGGVRPDGTYGDLDRPGGVRRSGGGMPGYGDQLSPEEYAALVIYVRQEIAGGDSSVDPNFNAELFEADHKVLDAMVEAVAALPANDPESVATVEGAETE